MATSKQRWLDAQEEGDPLLGPSVIIVGPMITVGRSRIRDLVPDEPLVTEAERVAADKAHATEAGAADVNDFALTDPLGDPAPDHKGRNR